jgi:beta-hydroxyacyl-ACP dehydratase FabZ
MSHQLVRRLLDQQQAVDREALLLRDAALDIRRIQRILPHRYPMLLVDRVLEIVGDQKAVGIKNVTYNEVFFQGHYPGTPIMPGVLVVEALAQLGGILLSQKLEHTGKVAMMLSMDKVKMRHPVVPGDQLILEAVTVRVKSRTGHVRCKAFVGDKLAAEADIKFMLVDAEPL